ncbi:hypothetical protein Nepgr_000375 [Nepenthes gracilis]|uniref:Uncharacterized protein n=1 Tax=Nepenthes gracilis TaxID=150966 RepID=A0AAD3RWE3_NEPGR|nr:hypothetical protein Nepgr_000375 [Nepenthes gracilis]
MDNRLYCMHNAWCYFYYAECKARVDVVNLTTCGVSSRVKGTLFAFLTFSVEWFPLANPIASLNKVADGCNYLNLKLEGVVREGIHHRDKTSEVG